MRRRDFIKAIGWAAAAWPPAARAQRSLPMIGFLGIESPYLWASRLSAFRQGLGEAGFIEGRNVAVEYRWAEGQYDRLPALASELVHRQVTLIATGTIAAVRAANAATTTIPIVFVTAGDPVQLGLVASLNRPGGNLTGVTYLGVEVGPKRVELMHEIVPKTNIVALLVNPTNPILAETLTRVAESAARSLGLQLHVFNASTEHDFDNVFATLVQLRLGGLVIGSDALFTSRTEQLATLAARYAVPTIFESREFVAAGGLVSYGASLTDMCTVKPAPTLDVFSRVRSLRTYRCRSPHEFELIINLKTAKALGLTIPTGVLVRADEVIE